MYQCRYARYRMFMTNYTFDKVDEIALGFAQAIAGGGARTLDINEQAMNLALNWIDNIESRRRIYTQNYPSWEPLTRDCKYPFEKDKKYWIATLTDNGERASVQYAEFYEKRSSYDEYPFIFTGEDKLGTEAHYFIKPENAEIFNTNFRPNKPNPSKVKKVNPRPVSIPRIPSQWP